MTNPTRALQAADGGPPELQSIVVALSTQFDVVTGPREPVRRIRLDTFDHRLAAAGLTLEHQTLAAGQRLVLGRPDGSSTWQVQVNAVRWPALAGVLPPGPVQEEIAPVTGIRALMVLSDERRRVRRLALQNKDGKTVVRVELDEPASTDAAPAKVTVRPLRGYDDQARRADRLLGDLGLRAVEQTGGGDPGSAPTTARMDREVPARLLLATALSEFLAAMRDNLPGLLDDVDTEFLHDFRVAVRRSRATLKLGRPVLPDTMQTTWEPAIKRLGDRTTPARDLDVYQLDLPSMAGWLVSADPADLEPFATHLRGRRTAEHRRLVRWLRSAAFGRLVTEWGDELVRLGDVSGDAHGDVSGDGGREQLSAGWLADRSIGRAHQRVVRGGALISADSPAEDLHELRKRCKELRYALEVFSPLIDPPSRKRAVNDLKGLQDVLGRFQDTEVQRRALRGFAEEMMARGTPAGAVLAMGELIGHLDAEQDRARHEFGVVFARFVRPSSLELMRRLGSTR